MKVYDMHSLKMESMVGCRSEVIRPYYYQHHHYYYHHHHHYYYYYY